MAAQTADPLRDLELLIRSRYGIIRVDTVEEERLEALLRHLADRLKVGLFIWSRTKGLRNAVQADQAAADPARVPFVYGSQEPVGALTWVEQSNVPAIYYFCGLGQFLDNALVGGKLADAGRQFNKRAGAVVMTGPGESLPEALRPAVADWRLPEPGLDDYKTLLQSVYRELSTRQALPAHISQDEMDQLLRSLRGLTLMEAEKVLTRAMVERGELSADALKGVAAAKKAIVEREGLLEYYPVDGALPDLAGLGGLKAWLAKRREILAQPQKAASFGLTFPKGILLIGVQGCGKSLCAKAVACEWRLPLLKLDPSGLYNKYVGESERNFQRAMETAERVAPIVLWIDELEKAFSQGGGDQDGGVSQRILGTFLSWLQDRKGDVFVAATANDVSRLPPEFIRKGRFDEIFFVDLPSPAAREAIFRVHLAKRGKDPARLDLKALVAATDGFSGAEVEQVVVSALCTAFSSNAELSTDLLLSEVAATVPLSRTMREPMERLRDWARSRCVSAD